MAYIYNNSVVVVPASATEIKNSEFIYKTNIKSIIFEPRDNNIPFIIGYNAFLYCDLTGEIIIPACVAKICWSAFAHNGNLTSVIFEPRDNNISLDIGYGAFKYCNIIQLIIPPFINEIGNCSFENNENLTSLLFDKRDDSTLIIGASAFENCDLRQLIIPKFIKNSVGFCVFANNRNLTSLEFEYRDTLLKICNFAFDRCNIKQLFIYKFIYELECQSFRNNTNLSNIIIEPRDMIDAAAAAFIDFEKYWHKIGLSICSKHVFYNCSLSQVILPNDQNITEREQIRYFGKNGISFIVYYGSEHNKQRRKELLKYVHQTNAVAIPNTAINKFVTAAKIARIDWVRHIASYI